MTRERKELGVGTVLEDIQAQQEVVRARSEYVAAVTELNQEQYSLLRATGSTLQKP
jgi:outer membrane protein TolC